MNECEVMQQQGYENSVLSIPECLDQGIALVNEGRLSEAITCYQRKLHEAPGNIALLNNLANTLQLAGRFPEANGIYLTLLARAKKPLAMRIASNYLAGLQYQQEYDVATLKVMTVALGVQFGDAEKVPPAGFHASPLRIGFVSADLCDHPVGLFLLPLLRNLDRNRFTPILYSAGSRDDTTARSLRGLAEWHDIASQDNDALLEFLRDARLHVLVDLSGHTAGNRLPVFARRAAPVQISWMGYFATTGIPAIDAVLMDPWHCPSGTESQFSEQLIRLPSSRFCYSPVQFAPEVSPPPCLKSGFITFGSFNNTAKLNPQVFSVWAKVLHAVPESRVILKWPTFADADYAQYVLEIFAGHGVGASRVELRGRSFHVDLLKEYADIDIALDPFPFTGGHTSCEALWMGCPIITLPGPRPVSRQTLCFLENIGLGEFAVQDESSYINKAAALAANPELLAELRSTLRPRMQASPLMDAKRFTREFEQTLIRMVAEAGRHDAAKESNAMNGPLVLLNIGAGHPASGARIPPAFSGQDWKEVRLDIDPANKPDILGTMLDMSAVASESVDAIYTSHTIEHLYPSEIPIAAREILRVLKPNGFAVITCPDLQAAAQMIAEDRLMETAYISPGGPVTPFDIVFSHRKFTGRDKPFMAHHCGFTLSVLLGTLKTHGFASVIGRRGAAAFDLWVVASKAPLADDEMRELAGKVLPS